ncbi:hypothetical protein AAG593_09445 [Citromicrobium bathyomarinum]
MMGLVGKPRALDPEQWQQGDLAECIWPNGWTDAATGKLSDGPAYREVSMVAKVKVKRCPVRQQDIVCLAFDRFPGNHYDAGFFRKVRPSEDEPIAAESAFTDLIRKQPARCAAGEGA